MYETLDTVTLRDGKKVEVGVVQAPDLEWSERIEGFLGHQEDIWNWQNHKVLHCDLGIDVFFYILHLEGQPLSSMMSVECQGVGIRAHVWTPPKERGNGACSSLQTLQMEHFRSRGGRYLCLYTDYNSIPFHIYRRLGFHGVEPLGGHMQFLSLPKDQFTESYFAVGETEIEPLSWRHWPNAAPLFMGEFPGRVRCAPLGLVGQQSSEYPLLEVLREAEQDKSGQPPRVAVLRNRATEAIVGLAAWSWHPRDQDACLVDVYCNPHYWDQAGDLLASLQIPETARRFSYADSTCEQKAECLLAHGFRRTAAWSRFPVDLCRSPVNRFPETALGGRVARTLWTLARAIDAPVSKCWRSLVEATGARARIPAKWPRFPLTHQLYVNLSLYEKN
jgi:hypothetical protein